VVREETYERQGWAGRERDKAVCVTVKAVCVTVDVREETSKGEKKERQ
jgi:hypothetical protein